MGAVAVVGAAAGVAYLVDRVAGVAASRCRELRDSGIRRCAEWRDKGYKACADYEDQGYKACKEYRDEGYKACSKWDRQCCDWWPCSWACKLLTWICVAWYWVSNWVCVAWYWVSKWVCVAWYWVSNWVCVAWYWTGFVFCVQWCFIRRLFARNEMSFSRSECIYGWTAAFRIAEQRDCRLAVVLRIRLQPDAGVTAQQIQAVQAVWEPAIEQAWTDRLLLVRTKGDCACREYRVTLDVQWVTSGEHHVVQVHAGSGRADMGNWFLNSSGGTAAHEVGHMLGYADEYSDPACPSRTVTSDGSIMQTTSGQVLQRHYQGFADWVSNRTCCDYAVSPDDGR
jgi:hypothetical protein